MPAIGKDLHLNLISRNMDCRNVQSLSNTRKHDTHSVTGEMFEK